MPGSSATAVRGVSKLSLDAFLERFGEGSICAQDRYDALARYEELPVRTTIRGGRGWKRDLAKLDLSAVEPFAATAGYEPLRDALSPAALAAGVTIERFSHARRQHRAAFEAAFGRALDTREDKFASLALAFQNQGAFIDVPAGVSLDEPLTSALEPDGAAVFSYTLVALGEGARATVVERIAADGATPFVGAITEIVLADRAKLVYLVDQRAGAETTLVSTRRAVLGAGASLDIGFAELGGAHVVSRFRATAAANGARTGVVVVFFSDGDQHVDVETETVHAAPNTTSETIVRSAGIGHGQGRYLGNIKILAAAHGADAALRDDALLLSDGAHIDSVPALEIAANDVKAFHGATVGAISEDELFYAESRGIARTDAERMIALGFFEPAVARFGLAELRDELRSALEAKIGATAEFARR